MTDNEEGKFVADTIQNKSCATTITTAISPSCTVQIPRAAPLKKACAHGHSLYNVWRLSFYSGKRSRISSLTCASSSIPATRSAQKDHHYPTRGIGKTSIDRAVLAATREYHPLGSAGRAKEFGFKAGTLEAVENFVLMIHSSPVCWPQRTHMKSRHVGNKPALSKSSSTIRPHEGLARYENVQDC